MADDERVLTSFVGEDETLDDTWTVRGVAEGTSRVPPAIDSGELLVITDRRLMWFDGELFDVEVTADTDVEYRDYTHTATPTIVSVGWALFFLSALVTVAAYLFLDVDTLTALLPGLSGFGVLLLMRVTARVRGETGEEIDLHRLVVESDGDVATIWCESEDLEGLQTALGHGQEDDGPVESPGDDDSGEPEESDGSDEPEESDGSGVPEEGDSSGEREDDENDELDDEPAGAASGSAVADERADDAESTEAGDRSEAGADRKPLGNR